MLRFREVRDAQGKITHIETSSSGHKLLNTAKLNKGNAFTPDERCEFNLEGKLPLHVETLEQQINRFYAQYLERTNKLQKNIFLNALHDTNETLFFGLVGQHIKEMLPILYTPTVGDAVEKFSLEMTKPRGLYVSYPNIDNIDQILKNRLNPEVDIIVVTDGEGVLGIGDQGVGGINICVAKLAVYTLCGGVHPHRVLPIQLDVGTNNENLLDDPMYLGWRHHRIVGKDYDNFIDKFVSAVQRNFPNVFLHWEDFGRENARKNLDRYRDKMCTFNDDMQGTGAVTLACILAGIKASDQKLEQQQIVIFGGGTAGCGIADQIKAALVRTGLSEEQARKHFWVIDRDGLLLNNMEQLCDFQVPYAHDPKDVSHWQCDDKNCISLLDVVRNAKPTILIGCSACAGAFNFEVISEMIKHTKKPIILPLSNPTSRAEAVPEDIIKWTDGNVFMATGSPFPPVRFQNHDITIAQSNNAFVFPGIGLGVISAKATRLTDNMIWAACSTLSDNSPALLEDQQQSLLPDLNNARKISRKIALAVAKQAQLDGVAQVDDDVDLEQHIANTKWKPHYYPYKKVDEMEE